MGHTQTILTFIDHTLMVTGDTLYTVIMIKTSKKPRSFHANQENMLFGDNSRILPPNQNASNFCVAICPVN